MVSTLIKHLQNNSKLIELLNGDNICYLEKPLKFNPSHYLLIKDKLIEDSFVKTYQLQIDVIGKDVEKVIAIEEELRKYLNDLIGQKKIKYEDKVIKSIKVLNGGGTLKDEKDNWIKIVFFYVKFKF